MNLLSVSFTAIIQKFCQKTKILTKILIFFDEVIFPDVDENFLCQPSGPLVLVVAEDTGHVALVKGAG